MNSHAGSWLLLIYKAEIQSLLQQLSMVAKNKGSYWCYETISNKGIVRWHYLQFPNTGYSIRLHLLPLVELC